MDFVIEPDSENDVLVSIREPIIVNTETENIVYESDSDQSVIDNNQPVIDDNKSDIVSESEKYQSVNDSESESEIESVKVPIRNVKKKVTIVKDDNVFLTTELKKCKKYILKLEKRLSNCDNAIERLQREMLILRTRK